MVHVSLVNNRPTYKRGVARILLVCHAPFISNYFCVSNCLLASSRDVALEWYRMVLHRNTMGIAVNFEINNTLAALKMEIKVQHLWYLCFLNFYCKPYTDREG